MSLKVAVYTPNRIVYNAFAEELHIPIEIGNFAVRKSFQKHFAVISTGLLRIKNADGWVLLLASDGIVEIINDNVRIFIKDVEEISSVDSIELNIQLKQKKQEECKTEDAKKKNKEAIMRLRGLLQAEKYLSFKK
jgi:F0F1-type ATP synthase epsilon subunit